MESVAVTPSEELTGLRARKNSLMGLKPSAEVLRAVNQLLSEMGRFRALNPKFAGVVNDWEVELLNSFPGAEP